MNTDNIVGGAVGILTLKVAGDLLTKGKKSGKQSSKKSGSVAFSKIKW